MASVTSHSRMLITQEADRTSLSRILYTGLTRLWKKLSSLDTPRRLRSASVSAHVSSLTHQWNHRKGSTMRCSTSMGSLLVNGTMSTHSTNRMCSTQHTFARNALAMVVAPKKNVQVNKMDQTVVVVMLGVLCSCVLAALALLALFLLNKGTGGDAYKGLPSTLDTSGLSQQSQEIMAQLLESKSSCWHFNHLARVTMPPYVRKLDKLQKDLPTIGLNKFQAQSQELGNAMLRDTEEALRKCPDTMTATVKQPDGSTKTMTKQELLLSIKLFKEFEKFLNVLKDQLQKQKT